VIASNVFRHIICSEIVKNNQEKIMAVSKEEILEAIASMSVLELSQLIKEMEEKFGVSAAAAAAVAVAAPSWRWRCAPELQNKPNLLLF
jgi:large subunit ribosomal protein L7/L12